MNGFRCFRWLFWDLRWLNSLNFFFLFFFMKRYLEKIFIELMLWTRSVEWRMVLSIFQTNLQKQLMNEKWPTCIRGIVYDVESKFQMEKWSLCKQCGLVHSPRCAIDQTTTKYPSQPKEQFIFKRRQKRMHLLFAYREQAEIGRWNIHLEMKFAAIKSKTDGPFTAVSYTHLTLPTIYSV